MGGSLIRILVVFIVFLVTYSPIFAEEDHKDKAATTSSHPFGPARELTQDEVKMFSNWFFPGSEKLVEDHFKKSFVPDMQENDKTPSNASPNASKIAKDEAQFWGRVGAKRIQELIGSKDDLNSLGIIQKKLKEAKAKQPPDKTAIAELEVTTAVG